MMKILHTADWHLGVKVALRDRLAVQRAKLQEIINLCDKEDIDVVLIAGDIYNSSTPSSVAEELFFETVELLSKGGERAVFVLAGNHDDPARIIAGLPLCYRHNIIIASSLEPLDAQRFIRGKRVEVTECGRGYIKLRKGEEKLNLAYLPFDSTIKENPNYGKTSYSESVGEVLNQCVECFENGATNIICSHLFMVGSRLSKDKVVEVGDVFAVSARDIPMADYVALGHLHRPQTVAPQISYSGSLVRLNVSSYPLGVNILDSKSDEGVKFVPFSSQERFEKVRAESLKEAEEKLEEFDALDMVELELVLEHALEASETKALKKRFQTINEIQFTRKFEQNEEKGAAEIKSRRMLPDCELFREFYKVKRGLEATDELVKMFLECRGGQR